MELKWLARCSKSGENYRKTKQNKNFGIGTIFKGDRRNMLIFPKHFLRNTELYYISTASYSLCLFSLLIARSNQGRVWTTTSRLLEMCPVPTRFAQWNHPTMHFWVCPINNMICEYNYHDFSYLRHDLT